MMDLDREEACAAIPLPVSMSAPLVGYEWARDNVGESGGAVYRLHGKVGAPDLFLKHGLGSAAGDLTDEMLRLRWLARYIPVPAIEGFVATHDEAWLLMTAVPGQTAYQVLEAQPDACVGIVDALATFLRRLHAIPTSECPFNSDHAYRLSRARERIDADLVDEDDFDDEREGWTAEQVWEAMQRLLPMPSDLVVTHGDFTLDNILMLDGEVVACIDAGRVGIADRYQDLAILWNCLGEFDASLQNRLIEASTDHELATTRPYMNEELLHPAQRLHPQSLTVICYLVCRETDKASESSNHPGEVHRALLVGDSDLRRAGSLPRH